MKKKTTKLSTYPVDVFDEFLTELTSLLNNVGGFPCEHQLQHMTKKLYDERVVVGASMRADRAVQKWLQCEELNRATSIRLMHADEDTLIGTSTWPRVRRMLRNRIRAVIGESIPWGNLLHKGSFSNGASVSVRRGYGTIPRKYLHGSDITVECMPLFSKIHEGSVEDEQAFNNMWQPELVVTNSNVLFTVPKNVDIDRCAAKEPTLNMYVQKALGDYIRQCLRYKGTNLNDQTINQRLAYEGSLTGNLATLDLSAASDSVTEQLIIELFPFEWASALQSTRSPFTLLPNGEYHENFMISSMGNATTFEVESLIFRALTEVAMELSMGKRSNFSIYGDDIICPTACVPTLIELLSFCGFSVNTEKSFWEGAFRESCGKHYVGGHDVTPFYIRKVAVDVRDWIHLLNSYRSWVHRTQAIVGILDPRFYNLWFKFAIKIVPLPIWGGYDYEAKDVLVSHGRRNLARIVQRVRVVTGKRLDDVIQGCYLHWLNSAEASVSGNHVRELVTSVISEDTNIQTWVRAPKTDPWRTQCAPFPQELGIGKS